MDEAFSSTGRRALNEMLPCARARYGGAAAQNVKSSCVEARIHNLKGAVVHHNGMVLYFVHTFFQNTTAIIMYYL